MNRLNDRHLTRLMYFISYTGLLPGRKAISRFCFCLFLLCVASRADADIPAQIPLPLTTSAKPNLLVILDTSNSMDEDPTGAAQGSNCPTSKSEIARSVIQNIISSYTNDINMGLMTYQLPAISPAHLYDTKYDVSYNPANYNPAFIPPAIGPNAPTTKNKRISNPTSPGNFIYYNVALPFYEQYAYPNLFCYSQTASAFQNGENTPGSASYGLLDYYRCFNAKTGHSDTPPTWAITWPQYPVSLSPINVWPTASEGAQGYPVTASSPPYLGIILNSRSDSDFALGITDYGKQIYLHLVGSAYVSSVSPGRGYLDVPINLLTTAQGNTIQNRLACNVPNTGSFIPASCTQNAPCTNSGIINAGNTPTEGTLYTAHDYFGGVLSDPLQAFTGYSTSAYPLPQSCGKNFVILVTDGLPDTTPTGVTAADTAAANADAAAAAVAAGVLATPTSLNPLGVQTYVVGFGTETQSAQQTAQLNAIAVAGGTGSAYSASDYPTLAAALDAILQDILSNSNSAASVAGNSTQLNTGTEVYQATFNATDWSGQLLAYNVNTSTGALMTPPVWDVPSQTPLPSPNARKIYTYDPTAAQGSSFQWNSLTHTPAGTSQRDYLNTLNGNNDNNGKLRVAWLRGDQSQEQSAGGIFRNRTDLLGDIINSDPVYVGSTDYGYSVLPSSGGGSSYGAFLTAKASRQAMLYVGANDGMLHGFNATNGTEVFAYIPNALFPKLSALTSPSYTHQYYVDGLSGVGDVYNGTNWHTLLAGITGAGGRAVFGLDVTNPVAFGTNNVLWEYTNTTKADGTPNISTFPGTPDPDGSDFGYTLAQPSVVRLQDGTWAVIVANGYDSDNGHAVLFILDAIKGTVLQKIDTVSADASGLATANGLSSPVAVDTNSPPDFSVDTVYAGDLHGNLWKFNVSGTVGSYPVPSSPLFVATDPSGIRQPITGKPNVGPSPVGDQTTFMVYFGTGQYFASGDNSIPSPPNYPQVQTVYGIWDQGTTMPANFIPITGRSSLQTQTITYEGSATTVGGTATTNPIVEISQHSVCYAATSAGCTTGSALKKGWALDLLNPNFSPPSNAVGERVVSAPVVRQGFVLFTTLIPNPNQCSYGGTSNFLAVSALTGGASSIAPFDTNGNGVVDSNDLLTVTSGGVSSTVAASGINLGIGIISTPAIIEASTVGYAYFSGSTGNTAKLALSGSAGGKGGPNGSGSGRQSWLQLQ